MLAFNRKNRKIGFITKGGKQTEILDYGYIRTWTITWNERTTGGGVAIGFAAVGSGRTLRTYVCIEIGTTDINRPLLRISMPSFSQAEHAHERITIMINH